MSGIIRRIDELGRIVLPKEMRKILKISTGDALEVSLENGEVLIKKYLPLSKNTAEIEDFLKTLSTVTSKSVIITDRQQVILGVGDFEFLKGEKLSEKALEIIKNNGSFSLSKKDGASPIKLTLNSSEDAFSQIIMPITSGQNEAIGLICVCSLNDEGAFDATDIKLLKFATLLLYNAYSKV